MDWFPWVLAATVGPGLCALWLALHSARPEPWNWASKELGLTRFHDLDRLCDPWWKTTALLSGTIAGCPVRVQLLEGDPGSRMLGRRPEERTRVTSSLAPQPRAEARPTEAALAAFFHLRSAGAGAHDGVILLEAQDRLRDAVLVSLVRAMVLVCSDEGRATLEAFVAGREPQSPRPAPSWLMVESAEVRKADALRFLLLLHGYAACTGTVSQVLESGAETTRCAAVEAIGRAKDVVFLDRLAALSEHSGDRLAETIADALASLGDARAETALLRLLERESGSVRRAAAAALGQIGTVRAVESLFPLTEGLLPSGVKIAAREAIAKIQARLGDAEPGRLSLVAEGPAEGALSVAKDGGGRPLDPAVCEKE